MAISQSEIRNTTVATHFSGGSIKTANSLNEAKASSIDTAFLCHSHKDRDLAEKIQTYLQSKGWSVYIDWKDSSMPEIPDRETANKIQSRIKDCDWFLFLATSNSMSSKWCPWELGFSDGEKGKDCIIIIPTSDSSGTAYGNEYMQLYRRIDYTLGSGSGVKRIEAGNSYSGTALSEL